MARKSPSNEEAVLQDEFLQDEATIQDWLEDDNQEEIEGQLAVDVYQTKENVVIKAPISGVDSKNLDVSIAEEVVEIRGERVQETTVPADDYYVQECYWGTFSRSIILPASVNAERPKLASRMGY